MPHRLPPTDDTTFFHHAFLHNVLRRYALMRTLAEAQRLDQKYDERRGPITDTLLAHHLPGEIALAVPAAVDGHAHLLPIDIDAGGIEAVRVLIAEAHWRNLWAFGQYCPRAGLDDQDQRGYVWLPFDQIVDKDRLMALEAELIGTTNRLGWKVEPRGIHTVTRLPLACHKHTGRFGDLILTELTINIDQDSPGALADLRQAHRENLSAALPELPPPPKPTPRPARKKGLYFCPFHPDDHASLQVYSAGGKRYVHCLSKHSDCPLLDTAEMTPSMSTVSARASIPKTHFASSTVGSSLFRAGHELAHPDRKRQPWIPD